MLDRIRETDRLRLEPIGPGHVDDLLALYRDPAVAEWYGKLRAERLTRRRERLGEPGARAVVRLMPW